MVLDDVGVQLLLVYSSICGIPRLIGPHCSLYASNLWKKLHSFTSHYERYSPATTQPLVLLTACVPKHTGSIRINTYAAVAPRILKGFAKVKRLANTMKRIENPDITRVPRLECVVTRCWSSQSGPINIARPSASVIHVRPWSSIAPVR